VDYLGFLGACAAKRGDTDTARAISQILQTLADPDAPGHHTLWRARLAAVLGDHRHAVDLLRESLAQGAIFGLPLHQSTQLESLRDYPPFQELVKPKD
jgi:hypothetical protein